MRIKLLQSRAGVDFSQNAGEEIDAPEAEAIRMIEAGQAIPAAPKIERAVKAPVEKRKK